jgi:hypothetical protein
VTHVSPGPAMVRPLLLVLSLASCLDGRIGGGDFGPTVVHARDGPTAGDKPFVPASAPDSGAAGTASGERDAARAAGGADRPVDSPADASRADTGHVDSPGGPLVLDCGSSGLALETHGPVANRVNYIILGDGYVASELDTTYLAHVRGMVAALFSERNEPYRRYRRFLNVCVLKVASNESGVDGDGRVRDTAFDGRGDDRSRLGLVNGTKVRAAIARLLPHDIDVDWRSVVLNSDQWWHSGGPIMVWSGGGSRSADAAVHEGGHSFHRLADEYDAGSCLGTGEPTEINVTADPTGQLKWREWLDFNQIPGTGLQRPVQGGRYCRSGIYRPSNNSLMRSVPGAFNAISREKIIRDIYDIVSPIDSATDGRAIPHPPELRVTVVDPTVVKVDWSVDGQLASADGGETFRPAALAPGNHTVSARAYDDTPWVRGNRIRLQETVQWSVTVP